MCQTVASLLIFQQIPIELVIKIGDMRKSHFEKTYNPIFEQYFNQDVQKNSKAQRLIWNKYSMVLPKPLISFLFYQYPHGWADNQSSETKGT